MEPVQQRVQGKGRVEAVVVPSVRGGSGLLTVRCVRRCGLRVVLSRRGRCSERSGG